MDTIAISKFKATCLAAIDRVRRTGRPLLITKRGEPVAQVVPPPPPAGTGGKSFGAMKDTSRILGDLVEPLGEHEWDALQD